MHFLAKNGTLIHPTPPTLPAWGGVWRQTFMCRSYQPKEEVDHFQYQGSILSNDAVAERDLTSYIGKADSVFNSLKPVWSATALSRTTKLCLYMAVDLSMAIYTRETWKSTANMSHKLNVFY